MHLLYLCGKCSSNVDDKSFSKPHKRLLLSGRKIPIKSYHAAFPYNFFIIPNHICFDLILRILLRCKSRLSIIGK